MLPISKFHITALFNSPYNSDNTESLQLKTVESQQLQKLPLHKAPRLTVRLYSEIENLSVETDNWSADKHRLMAEYNSSIIQPCQE